MSFAPSWSHACSRNRSLLQVTKWEAKHHHCALLLSNFARKTFLIVGNARRKMPSFRKMPFSVFLSLGVLLFLLGGCNVSRKSDSQSRFKTQFELSQSIDWFGSNNAIYRNMQFLLIVADRTTLNTTQLESMHIQKRGHWT